jgi:hypothetical protein
MKEVLLWATAVLPLTKHRMHADDAESLGSASSKRVLQTVKHLLAGSDEGNNFVILFLLEAGAARDMPAKRMRITSFTLRHITETALHPKFCFLSPKNSVNINRACTPALPLQSTNGTESIHASMKFLAMKCA